MSSHGFATRGLAVSGTDEIGTGRETRRPTARQEDTTNGLRVRQRYACHRRTPSMPRAWTGRRPRRRRRGIRRQRRRTRRHPRVDQPRPATGSGSTTHRAPSPRFAQEPRRQGRAGLAPANPRGQRKHHATMTPQTASAAAPGGLFGIPAGQGIRIGEALAVLWSEVDLDTGALTVTSTLIRVTGQGLLRKTTKSKAGQRALLLPTWCVAMLRRRSEVGVAPDEPIFATVDGRSAIRGTCRGIGSARDRLGFGWVTSHSWRKTMPTILDGGGASPRMIADQLGHSRVSMSLDFYLGRRSVDPRVLAALEAVDPHRFTLESGGQRVGQRTTLTRPEAYMLVREPTGGLEPLTPCLQDKCAANCATPAGLP